MQLYLNINNGTANIVDPNQTAPSGYGLQYLHIMPFCQKLMCTKLGHFTINLNSS